MTDDEARSIKSAKRRIKTASPAGEAPPLPVSLRYKGELGRGGMSLVVAAEQVATGRIVAVKFLPPALSEEAVIERFRREAAELSRLSHPNVVRLLETGRHAGQEYLVMEYIEGGNLLDFIARKPSLQRLLEFFCKICEGLEYVHEAGVVHRDLKPENILVTADGTPKLTDFGIALRQDRKTRLTEGGAILGTYAFLAPEQILTSGVGPPADVYSLGMCLYEALAQRPPFEAETEYGLLQAHLHQEPPPVSRFCPGVPPALDQLVGELLVKKPEDRPTVRQTLERLHECLRQLRGEPSDSQVADQAPPNGKAPRGELLPAGQALRADPAPPAGQALRAAAVPPAGQALGEAPEPGRREVRPARDERSEGARAGRFRAGARLLTAVALLVLVSVGAFLLYRTELVIESQPTDALVLLNGQPAGTTPLRARWLWPGEQRLELRHQGFNNHKIAARTVLGQSTRLPVVILPRVGTLVLHVTPEPVAVWVDGSMLAEARNGERLNVDSGKRTVELRKEGYSQRSESLEIPEGGEAALTAELTSATRGYLQVSSEPSGAQVALDGQPQGLSPVRLKELEPGEHVVTLSKPGFETHQEKVQVVAAKEAPVNAKLKPSVGALRIRSQPGGATVLLDGEKKGTTPLELQALEPGAHKLTLVRTGYLQYREDAAVEAGRTAEIQVSLKPAVGTLVITSDPAGAQVVVNGTSRGTTPLTLQNLPPRKYSLVLERSGYFAASKTLELQAGKTRNLAFHLEPAPPPPRPSVPDWTPSWDGGGGGSGGWTPPPVPVPTPDSVPVPVPTP
ncbi:MAG: serine/threonine protein kinase [Armatimonadetes bacterium]|nr:serine/threonine protein kinase [Armatimonadota bacterium]